MTQAVPANVHSLSPPNSPFGLSFRNDSSILHEEWPGHPLNGNGELRDEQGNPDRYERYCPYKNNALLVLGRLYGLVDRDNWKLYEIFAAYPSGTGYSAGSGAIFDLSSMLFVRRGGLPPTPPGCRSSRGSSVTTR